jgi:prepilin-type processing-associated H-X9-DG protein
LLLSQYLSSEPNVLFCPSSDQWVDAGAQLANVGKSQAQCSYYYRHAGNTNLFDAPGSNLASPDHIKLDNLGNNRNGQPVCALALDTMFLCPAELAPYGVKPSTHHQQKFANILFADGHVVSRPNPDSRFDVDLDNYNNIRSAFSMILGVLERADTEP